MPEPGKQPERGKSFLGILFECCHVYSRVYRKEDEMKYEGRCPKCLRTLTVKIDPVDGIEGRFLRAK